MWTTTVNDDVWVSAWGETEARATIDALVEINRSVKETVEELAAIRTLLEEENGRGDEEED